MKLSVSLILLLMVPLIYADSPKTVVIDGVEYIPLPKQEENNQQKYTIPASSLGGMEDCWYEQVPITGSTATEATPNVAGAIVGGIIGGVIGHQFGSGSGNTAATVGGAVLGTALGAKTNSNNNSAPQYQMIRKCNTIR